MATGRLYSYPDNFRAQKALIAARYSGASVSLVPDFVFGETNQTEVFLTKFPSGKVPAFESADGKVHLIESNAIAYYLSNEILRGVDPVHKAQVLQWLSWADSEVYPSSCAWVYPIMGIMKHNPKNEKRGEQEIKACLKLLDQQLRTKTFLVGERITLADIVVLCTFLHIIQYALTQEIGNSYVNVVRWMTTLLNQPEFKAVLGDIKLFSLDKIPVATKEVSTGKEKSGKEKKEKSKEKQPKEKTTKEEKPKESKDDDDEDEFHPPPSTNPFDTMPKGTFDMDAFKRVYSNEAESVSISYFFEHFDVENYSVWLAEYKYNNELTKVFMSCNLITGMFQRIEKMRKAAFASCCLFGKDNDSTISGLWVWRGQELAFPLSPDWQIDYESYNWTKLDFNSPETKTLIEQYFSWAGKDKNGREFNQGKIFK